MNWHNLTCVTTIIVAIATICGVASVNAEACCDPDRRQFSFFRGAFIGMKFDDAVEVSEHLFSLTKSTAEEDITPCREVLSICDDVEYLILRNKTEVCAIFVFRGGWARGLLMKECYFDARGIELSAFTRMMFREYGIERYETLSFGGTTIGYSGITESGEKISISYSTEFAQPSTGLKLIVKVVPIDLPQFK